MIIIETEKGFEFVANTDLPSEMDPLLDLSLRRHQEAKLLRLGLTVLARTGQGDSWNYFLSYCGFTFPINTLLGSEKEKDLTCFLNRLRSGNSRQELIDFLSQLANRDELGKFIHQDGALYHNMLNGMKYLLKKCDRHKETISSLLNKKDEFEKQVDEMILMLYGVRNPVGLS